MDAPLLSADQVRRIRIEEMTLDANLTFAVRAATTS
jgi:hypothetical protein